LDDSTELPSEFYEAARKAQRWTKRIASATVVGAIGVALSYLTSAGWVLVALALVAQVICLQRWWHYTNVMSIVGDNAISNLASEEGVAIQSQKGGGIRDFTSRHPTTVGILLGVVLLSVLIAVLVARHFL